MPSNNRKLNSWVDKMAALCQADDVRWCDGSQAEFDEMFEIMLASGTAERLDQKLRPNSWTRASGWQEPHGETTTASTMTVLQREGPRA